MVDGISHITLIVQDLERTGKLLGDVLEATEVYASGASRFSCAHERFYLLGQVWIAIMEGSRSAERSYDHVAFKIPQSRFEECKRRLERAGIELLGGRPRVEGEGSSLYFYDYDNHLFELHTGTLEERLRAYQEASPPSSSENDC